MLKTLRDKLKEVLPSVAPIVLIVIILMLTVTPMPAAETEMFGIGTVMLILGTGLFMLGADIALLPMGEMIGSSLTRSKKLKLIVIFGLIIGFFITIAEPDVQVLAKQFTAAPDMVLVCSIALGVGVFLVLGLLRIVFGWSLRLILIILYVALFAVAAFVPKEFLAVAFDSGGVTTGPITVPFILSLGVGVSAVRSDKKSHDDSFGLVAICSVGPILTMLIMGLLLSNAGSIDTSSEVVRQTVSDLPHLFPEYGKEVIFALFPMLLIFIGFNIKTIKLGRTATLRILVGFVYAFFGLSMFLMGVNIGFMPAGTFMGGELATKFSTPYILVPLGMILGATVVAAEPAVHVLTREVENVSGGAVSRKSMLFALSGGVALSIGLAMVRVITGLSLWWFIIPIYAVALILTVFSPKIFTAIAFDSGGVASGAMTATFLMPFATGASKALGGNVLADAFGLVTMVAATPLIAIQLLGLVYNKRKKTTIPEVIITPTTDQTDEIIDL